MLYSRVFIWLEFVFVVVPTTFGAVFLMLGTIKILTDNIFESSYQDILLWLVPIGTIFGIVAQWVMFFAILKKVPISQLVDFGFASGIGVVVFTAVSGFDPRFSSWWTLPIKLFLNLGLPYMLVGWHWLYLLKKGNQKRIKTRKSVKGDGGIKL